MAPGTGEPDVQSMKAARSDTLTVPGASLYYEVRGAGPVLLMIPGGPADAGAFAGIARLLADRHTVVAYDPRGNSRSSLEGPPEDWRADVRSDDASRLLAAVGTAPAYVLSSSGGAQIGLDLAARHPEQVHTLIAHEPPAVELLPDAARQRAFFQEVYDSYRSDEVGPAMQSSSSAPAWSELALGFSRAIGRRQVRSRAAGRRPRRRRCRRGWRGASTSSSPTGCGRSAATGPTSAR